MSAAGTATWLLLPLSVPSLQAGARGAGRVSGYANDKRLSDAATSLGPVGHAPHAGGTSRDAAAQVVPQVHVLARVQRAAQLAAQHRGVKWAEST